MILRFRVAGSGPLVDTVAAAQVPRLRPLLAFALARGVAPAKILAAVPRIRAHPRTVAAAGVVLAELLTGTDSPRGG